MTGEYGMLEGGARQPGKGAPRVTDSLEKTRDLIAQASTA